MNITTTYGIVSSAIIDNCIKNEKVSLNIEHLIGFVIDKINRSGSDETIINELETILLKLLNSGFNSTVQTFCFYLISNYSSAKP